MSERLRKAILEHKDETLGCIIDITNKCNLKCKHCYYYKGLPFPTKQLSDEEWVARVEKLKEEYPDLVHCVFLGGEPMLRFKLIKKLSKFFEQSWVVTNGMFHMEKHENIGFLVSVDGIKEHHEELRGKNYDRIKRNISGKNVYLNCTVNKRNWQNLKDFVYEWMGLVKGIRFAFYQPINDKEANEKYGLSKGDKNEALALLRVLKQEYGEFILNTERELELYKPENLELVKSDCAFKKGYYLKIDCMGNVKSGCPSSCRCSDTAVVIRTLMTEKSIEGLEQFLKVARND